LFIYAAQPDLFAAGSDTFASVVNTIQGWRPALSIVAWALIVAGFAMGLGRETGSVDTPALLEDQPTPA
jgi:hypothetical protein